jgi:hypothetical protein
MLSALPGADDAASKFNSYIAQDKRPWFEAAAAFKRFAEDRDTGGSSLERLIEFLNTPPTCGQDLIATTYTMVTMSLYLQSGATSPAYMRKALTNYEKVVLPQSNREKAGDPTFAPDAAVAGITLAHQPAASTDPSLIASKRPVTYNRMQAKLSTQNRIQLDKGLPFASGASGSTNILLHLLAEMREGGANLDGYAFLANAMMFLVYDGGHSIHEVLYVANQLERDKNRGRFGLRKSGEPAESFGFSSLKKPANKYATDYDAFIDVIPGELGKAFENAQEKAWNETQDYLLQNSAFADQDRVRTPGSAPAPR